MTRDLKIRFIAMALNVSEEKVRNVFVMIEEQEEREEQPTQQRPRAPRGVLKNLAKEAAKMAFEECSNGGFCPIEKFRKRVKNILKPKFAELGSGSLGCYTCIGQSGFDTMLEDAGLELIPIKDILVTKR